MTAEEQLIQKALELGAFKAGSISTAEIPFDPSLRQNCEMNYCGKYGRNYMCPSDCGEIHELIDKVKSYSGMVLFQTVDSLEDSFDIEGMEAAGVRFNGILHEMQGLARALCPDCLILGAGGCSLCPRCGKLDGIPCRHPEDAHPSLEAHGMYVAELAKRCGMQYINGQNTVTFFGAVVIR